MTAAKAILGIVLVVFVLWDAFETIILPRRPRHGFRITRTFYKMAWAPWKAAARSMRNPKQRETFLSLFGPLSIFLLLAIWALALVVGFAVLQWAAGSEVGGSMNHTFGTDFYFSGSTFFTLGLGDVTPQTNLARALAVIEAGTGFGFLALVISYIPVLYQSFSRREVSISLLDARAGTPPTGVELLRRHEGDMQELQQLLVEWEKWSAELLESHMSYPTLAYFRSQHDNQSWLASLTAVLDACALCMVGLKNGPARQARLTFAIARHALVDLAQVFNTPPMKDLDRMPAEDVARLCESLRRAGLEFPADITTSERLAKFRKMYEPYAGALARHLLVTLPPWVKPHTGADNWETSRWGRDTIV
jgi:hypothetical protein